MKISLIFSFRQFFCNKIEVEIRCPILKKVCEINPIYRQWKFCIRNKEIIVTTCYRGNNKCIIYLSGYDDCWYYHHVAEEYQDLDFISIDCEGFGVNKGYTYDNHLIYMNEICECISETIFKCCFNFENVYMMGFSMGGHIALYYTWLAERNEHLFLPKKLLLLSPLVNFYTEYPFIVSIGILLSRITYLFSSQIDLHSSYFDIEINDMLELEDIYSNEKLKKYEIDDFDISSIGGYHSKPFLNGTIVTVLNNMNTMLASNGILTETICVCSNKYGNEPLKEDNILNPEDIKKYLGIICNKLKLKQFDCGHNPLRQPYFTSVSFVDICNYLFEK